MIQVGIIGAEDPVAGELVRILLLHPEVELISVFAPRLKGRSLSSYYKGVVGETELNFSDVLPLGELDVVFIIGGFDLNSIQPLPEDLRVIHLPSKNSLQLFKSPDGMAFVPGISEMYRKPLVRGAKAAMIQPTPVTVAVIALFPLALHLLLNDSLQIRVNLPEFERKFYSASEIGKEVLGLLHPVQLSLENIRGVELEFADRIRTIIMELEFDCSVSVEEIEKIYNDIYGDHNFSFLMQKEPTAEEVAGTQKCLLYVSKPSDETIKVKAVADLILRGGAGDAVHAMNLLFGLHEKTGLSFPASMAFRPEQN